VLAELATKYAVEEAIDPDQVFTEVTDNFLMQVGKAGTLRTVANIARPCTNTGLGRLIAAG
jgi:hypothetical protein